MTFDEFVRDVKAKGGVDTDGYYGKQCMDLYNYYCRNVLELTGDTGADCAKHILNNSYVMNNVERIDNYPEFIPQKGDIAVWTGGDYGHVAICFGDANLNVFHTLDQNWKPQTLTEEWHNYLYMSPLVFLRPKNQKNINYTPFDIEVISDDGLNVREGAGTNYRIKTFDEFTPNAREQILNLCGYKANCLVKGVIATVSEVRGNWGKIPSGWICLDYTRRV